MRMAALVLASALAFSACATPPERHTVYSPAAPVAGTYRLPSGAVLELRPRAGNPGIYDAALLDGPATGIPSGTVVGELHCAGADAGSGADMRGDLILTTDPRKAGHRKKRVTFAATFSADGRRLTLDHYRQGVSVELLRLIPYLFRVGVERRDSRPADLDAAERLGAAPGYVVL